MNGEALDGTSFINVVPKEEEEPEYATKIADNITAKADTAIIQEDEDAEEYFIEMPYSVEDFDELFKRVEYLETKLKEVMERLREYIGPEFIKN